MNLWLLLSSLMIRKNSPIRYKFIGATWNISTLDKKSNLCSQKRNKDKSIILNWKGRSLKNWESLSNRPLEGILLTISKCSVHMARILILPPPILTSKVSHFGKIQKASTSSKMSWKSCQWTWFSMDRLKLSTQWAAISQTQRTVTWIWIPIFTNTSKNKRSICIMYTLKDKMEHMTTINTTWKSAFSQVTLIFDFTVIHKGKMKLKTFIQPCIWEISSIWSKRNKLKRLCPMVCISWHLHLTGYPLLWWNSKEKMLIKLYSFTSIFMSSLL